MRALKVVIIFLFFSSSVLHGKEYIVYNVQSSNFIYSYIIKKTFKKEKNRKIFISVIADTVYITYKTRKYQIPFAKIENNCKLFQTERKGYIAKVFIEQPSKENKQGIHLILKRKNGDTKIQVNLVAT